MDIYLYISYSIIYLILIIYTCSYTKHLNAMSTIVLVSLALLYDNSIIALGTSIGEGSLLYKLNAGRYWLHAFITPLLIIYCYGVLYASGIKSFHTKKWFKIALVLTIAMIAYEILTVAASLSLQPEYAFGTLRYFNTAENMWPPMMMITVTVILFTTALILFIKNRVKAMLIGTILMAVASILPMNIHSSALTNGGELLLMCSLVATYRKLQG